MRKLNRWDYSVFLAFILLVSLLLFEKLNVVVGIILLSFIVISYFKSIEQTSITFMEARKLTFNLIDDLQEERQIKPGRVVILDIGLREIEEIVPNKPEVKEDKFLSYVEVASRYYYLIEISWDGSLLGITRIIDNPKNFTISQIKNRQIHATLVRGRQKQGDDSVEVHD